MPLRRSLNNRKRSRIGGFTVVETVVACGMMAIFVIGSMLALTQMNRFATASRLRTLALALAEQRIDEVLTTPWNSSGPRPAVLVGGIRTETSMPLGEDTLNNQAGLSSNVTNLGVMVQAVRTTEITDVAPLRLRAAVTVAYTYRNRPQQVVLTTLRATDSF